MSRTAFLIPKRGLNVRDPDTLQLLPEGGAQVQLTSYWRRRIADGDATVQAAAPAKSNTTKPTAAGGAKE